MRVAGSLFAMVDAEQSWDGSGAPDGRLFCHSVVLTIRHTGYEFEQPFYWGRAHTRILLGNGEIVPVLRTCHAVFLRRSFAIMFCAYRDVASRAAILHTLNFFRTMLIA